ncbi:MAG: hypothetical protein CMF48_03230 [Legionellales bacterium]|nr:hypothetical protein [Legionellales bacterium]
MRDLSTLELKAISGGNKSDEYLATGVVMGAAGGILLMTGVIDALAGGGKISPWVYGVEALMVVGAAGAHVWSRYNHDELGFEVN